MPAPSSRPWPRRPRDPRCRRRRPVPPSRGSSRLRRPLRSGPAARAGRPLGRGRAPPPAVAPPGGATRGRPPYARRVASLRSGSASQARRGPPGARRPRAPGVRRSELLVGRLDGEEPRDVLLARRVRVMDLGQPAVGALDLVDRGARVAARACGTDRGRWPSCGPDGRTAVACPASAGSDQPMSSPTGASSKSAMVSAPSRPCGSWIAGR